MAIQLTIRSGSVVLQATPMVRQGVVWLPVRAAVEGLGGRVLWDAGTAGVVVALGNDRLQIQLDQQRAVSNGKPIALLSAPETNAGITYMTWYDLINHLPIASELLLSARAPVVPQILSEISLCIDPGHGGSDPGALGPTGLQEKTANLAVAHKLADLLRQAGARVVLTRDGDQTKSLAERSRLANDERVDWFVSIHSNSFFDSGANGTETYHYPGDGPGSRLAGSVQTRLIEALGRYNRGVKTADFHVMRETAMPAILTELAFISNPAEERLLADPQFQARAAQAIYQGILGVVAQK